MDADILDAFIREIRVAGNLPDNASAGRVLDAFRAVPREDHAGPGPWITMSGKRSLTHSRTPDSDPKHLYRNVLISLDIRRGINIGEPSLWAFLLARADVREGFRILQVGTGSGYYTAILAELVGPKGHVFATEIDKKLAAMAANALRARKNVTVRRMNAARDLSGDEGPFDLIVAFAGVTHPPELWRKLLRQGGRMLIPVTGADWWGAMVLLEDHGETMRGVTLGPCGFYPCEGARDAEAAKAFEAVWSRSDSLKGAGIEFLYQSGKPVYRHIAPDESES